MINPQSRRYRREYNTLRAMAEIYCQYFHSGPDGLCESCSSFLVYAQQRLEKCVFGNEKPACSECPIHCYRPEERERAKTIMKYSGPKMFARHPFLTLFHFWDKYWSALHIRAWRKARKNKQKST
jgi:hypothetical protein